MSFLVQKFVCLPKVFFLSFTGHFIVFTTSTDEKLFDKVLKTFFFLFIYWWSSLWYLNYRKILNKFSKWVKFSWQNFSIFLSKHKFWMQINHSFLICWVRIQYKICKNNFFLTKNDLRQTCTNFRVFNKSSKNGSNFMISLSDCLKLKTCVIISRLLV